MGKVLGVVLWAMVISKGALALDFSKAIQETKEGQALAKNPGNAYCELREQSSADVVGYQTEKLVSLASVSKVITSFWAVETLGIDYRFPTILHISEVSTGLFDVHIEGSLDPLMNREKLIHILSELNRNGIYHIRNLTFDENFSVFLNVRNIPHTEIGIRGGISSDETAANLLTVLNTESWNANAVKEVQAIRKNAEIVGAEILTQLKLKVDAIDFQDVATFKSTARKPGDYRLLYRSSPLANYLKEMNIYSNNYIADMLWKKLGAAGNFQKFIENKLKLDAKDIRFFTGSGLPVSDKAGKRLENQATCSAVLEVISGLDKDMEGAGLSLTDVMLVGGVDAGTLPSFSNEAMSGSVVAKTGTIRNAITLAGYASTAEGKYYFGVFFTIADSGQTAKARMVRDHVVASLIKQHKGKKQLSYKKLKIMPFDQDSKLMQVLDSGLL